MNLLINTIGEQRLTYGEKSVGSSDVKSKLIWILLSFLIVNMGKTPSIDEICDVLWDGKEVNDPVHAVKNVVYRLRLLIKNELSADKEEYIISSCGTYFWNVNAHFEIDSSGFIDDIKQIENDNPDYENAKEVCYKFIEKYNGNYLPVTESLHYFIAVRLGFANKFNKALIVICDKALKNIDSVLLKYASSVAVKNDYFNEDAQWYYMKSLIMQNETFLLTRQFEQYESRLLQEMMEKPSQKLTAMYMDFLKGNDDRQITIEEFVDTLDNNESDGAMILQFYNFFHIYRLVSRQTNRSKGQAFLILLSLNNVSNVHDAAIEVIDVLKNRLRRNDIVTRCTPTQFAIILTGLYYYNAVKVMEEIKNKINKRKKCKNVIISYKIKKMF